MRAGEIYLVEDIALVLGALDLISVLLFHWLLTNYMQPYIHKRKSIIAWRAIRQKI